jgi:hypothetical protein
MKEKMDWIKKLLNNITLLKWVRKFSADNLMENNELAKKLGISGNEESISVGDNTQVKLLVTQAHFSGKEFVRYDLKQVKEVLNLIDSEGRVLIGEENNRELFIQVGDSIIVIAPLSNEDEEKEAKADLIRKYDIPAEAEAQENFCN